MIFKRLSFILLGFSLLSLNACSDWFDDDTDAEVRSLTINNVVIRIGEKGEIDVDFRFSEDDVFNDNEDVVIAISLPMGVQYLVGSAEIDGFFSDEDVDPFISTCDDGSSILFFDFDEDDLSDLDDPSGSSDARLEFEVIGVAADEAGVIEAQADYNSVSAFCGAPLQAQESILISVVE